MDTAKSIIRYLILLIVIIMLCWGYGEYKELKIWGEHNSIVKLWPRLQKEEIKSISFCEASRPDTGDSDVIFEVPKENLQEFTEMLDHYCPVNVLGY